MVKVIIDGNAVEVADESTILEAAALTGVEIPTLCYFADLNDVGACRMCVVEVVGEERLAAACNTIVREGMEVITSSDAITEARETALRLLLSQHDLNCAYCQRSGTCKLQKLLLEYGIAAWDDWGNVVEVTANPYAKQLVKGRRAKWPSEIIVQRDTNKCVKCGRCIAACDKLENIGVWSFVGSGAFSNVGVADGLSMRDAGCVGCGQCITHCPTGALTERDDVEALKAAIADPEITTVVQIAPATRTSWGVGLGAEDGKLDVEVMVAALKQMGVDYVFDTSLAADLTIMEEGTELLHGLGGTAPDERGITWPMFTSCCPAWVRRVKDCYPDVLGHLSTAKSPMMMLGAVIKTWFAQKQNLDPAKIYSVALMPCTAKKHEVKLPMEANPGIPDMDGSLTTRELIRWVRSANIDVASLEPAPLDNPLGEYTGAGVIFGTTGGVMEAALRTAYFVATGQLPPPDGFEFVQSPHGCWVEATFALGDAAVRCAVAHGLSNADSLLDAIRNGVVEYDFVEIMACPSGCAGGGGQPIDGSEAERGLERGQTLRKLDKTKLPLRYSHENPQVQMLYEEYFGEPCSELAHHLLHTTHVAD